MIAPPSKYFPPKRLPQSVPTESSRHRNVCALHQSSMVGFSTSGSSRCTVVSTTYCIATHGERRVGSGGRSEACRVTLGGLNGRLGMPVEAVDVQRIFYGERALSDLRVHRMLRRKAFHETLSLHSQDKKDIPI